jgi:transposase
MKQRRNHAPEFKLKLVEQLLGGEKRPAQLCREHSLSETSLLNWRRAYAKRGQDAFKSARDDLETQLPRTSPRAARCRTRALGGALTFENSLLKTVSET